MPNGNISTCFLGRRYPHTRLSVKQIDAARHGSGPDRICDGGGLYLRLMRGGGKTFQLRHGTSAKRVWVTLGSYPELGLKTARDLAGTARGLFDEGVAPEDIAARLRQTKKPAQLIEVAKSAPRRKQTEEAPTAVMTFRQVAENWYATKVLRLKNGKHIAQNWSTLDPPCQQA